MFKISTIDTPRERRVVVEGTLVQPWVAELRKTWSNADSSLEGRQLVIDLRNATQIDSEGEAAIVELMKDGAKFCCSDVLTKHVLKQAADKCHTRLHNILNRRRSKDLKRQL
jgi:ABC-type transporter Mla MlaB component